MRLLAIDTATEACSAAYLDAERLIVRHEELRVGHAERILGMVDAVLREADVRLGALDALAVARGPGAFTGVRIAVSVVQGLAFGAGLPVVPLTTLEAMAYPLLRRGAPRVLACLDARMGEVYAGLFVADAERGVCAAGPLTVGPPEELILPEGPPLHAVGRGFTRHPALCAIPGLQWAAPDLDALPDAPEIALLGRLRFAHGGAITAGALEPLYLRDKVALTEAERGVA
jgi:tRNA threonylcarbamoyladenosine biosynthesis protein TsaB